MILFWDRNIERTGKSFETSWSYSQRKNSEGSGKIDLIVFPINARYATLFKGKEKYKDCLIEENSRNKNNTISTTIKTLETLLSHYRIPENWHGWDELPLSYVITDMLYGFETIRQSQVSEFQNYIEIANVSIQKVYDGDIHLAYYPTGNDYTFCNDGYITYAFDCGDSVSQRWIRWVEDIGEKVFISVQSVASEFPFSSTHLPDFTGVEKLLRRTGVENESSLYGVRIASDKRYVAVRFNLYMVNYDDTKDFAENSIYDDNNNLVTKRTYGCTPILRAFEVITRKKTEFTLYDAPVIPTIVSDMEFGNETLLEALKQLNKKYVFDFISFIETNHIYFKYASSLVIDKTKNSELMIRQGDVQNSSLNNTSINEITVNTQKINVLHCYGEGEYQNQLYVRIPSAGTYDGLEPVEDTFSDGSCKTKESLEALGNEELVLRRKEDSPEFEVDTQLSIRLFNKVTIVSPTMNTVYEAEVCEEKITYADNKVTQKFGIGGFVFNPFDALVKQDKYTANKSVNKMPFNIQTFPGVHSITLKWNGIADNFVIRWKKQENEHYNYQYINDNSFVFDSLSDDDVLIFAVAAITSGIQSTYSAEVAAQPDQNIKQITFGDTSEYPEDIDFVTAVAFQDYILCSCRWNGAGLKNTLKRFIWEISNDNGATWQTEYTTTNILYRNFVRLSDGYPEKTTGTKNLSLWRVRVRAENIYNQISFGYGPSVTGQTIDASQYKTWILPVPSIAAIAREQTLDYTITIDTESYYGSKKEFDLYINNVLRQEGIVLKTGSYTWDRSIFGYPETEAHGGTLNSLPIKIKARTAIKPDGTDSASVNPDVTQYKTWIPPKPVVTVIAQEKTLDYSFTIDTESYYGSGKSFNFYIGGVLKKSGTTMKADAYVWDRDTDGYPEKVANGGTLDSLSITIKAITVENQNGTLSDVTHPDVSKYLTWKPAKPTVNRGVAGRNASLKITQGNAVYGDVSYRLQITRKGNSSLGIADDDGYYALGNGADAYTDETSYRSGGLWGWTATPFGNYDQQLPLYNQSADLPADTCYYYRAFVAVAVPITGDPARVNVSAESDLSLVIAKGAGLKDIIPKSIQEASLAAGAVSYRAMSAGMSGNLIPNADFSAGLAGWDFISEGGSTGGFNMNPDWSIGSGIDESSTAYIHGYAGSLYTRFVCKKIFAVTPGERFEAYAYMGAHRCTAQLAIKWTNRDGSLNSYSAVSLLSWQAAGGNVLSAYKQHGLFADVPVGAAYAQVFVQMSAIETDPFIFFTYCFFGRATVNQTQFTAWHNGPVTLIRTENMEADSITGDRIKFNSLEGSKIVARSAMLETLNVLAYNKINPLTVVEDGTAGWILDTGCSIETVSGYRTLKAVTVGGNGAGAYFYTAEFEVLPEQLLEFSFGLQCPNYSSESGLYLGLSIDKTFTEYYFDFATKKWVETWTGGNKYFINNFISTDRKNFKTYILGSNIDIADVPAPKYTDQSYQISCLKLANGNTKVGVRTGFNATTPGTYWYLFLPQITVVGTGRIIAKQILVDSLSAITSRAGAFYGDPGTETETAFVMSDGMPDKKVTINGYVYNLGKRNTLIAGALSAGGYFRQMYNETLSQWETSFKAGSVTITSVASDITGTFSVKKSGYANSFYVDPTNYVGISGNVLLIKAGSGGDYNNGIRIANDDSNYAGIEFGTSYSVSGRQAGQCRIIKCPDGSLEINVPNSGNTGIMKTFSLTPGGAGRFEAGLTVVGAVTLSSTLSVTGETIFGATVVLPLNTRQLVYRDQDVNRSGAIMYDISGNECLAFMSKHPLTVFKFFSGLDPAGAAQGYAMQAVADVQLGAAGVLSKNGFGDIEGTSKIYIQNGNEINFGDSSYTDIFFGYRAIANRAIPSTFHFGGSGTATLMCGAIGRISHSSGLLIGSYNNVGSNDSKSNPIYTIGSNYLPSDTSLGSMFGIGYSHSNFWGNPSNIAARTGWGMYVCAAGSISVLLTELGIWTSGKIYAAGDIHADGALSVQGNIGFSGALQGIGSTTFVQCYWSPRPQVEYTTTMTALGLTTNGTITAGAITASGGFTGSEKTVARRAHINYSTNTATNEEGISSITNSGTTFTFTFDIPFTKAPIVIIFNNAGRPLVVDYTTSSTSYTLDALWNVGTFTFVFI